MSDETRQRILMAAGPIFADRGYERTTVREICTEAGVNQAGINYYFRSKELLYEETVRLAHSRRVEQAPEPQWSSDAPAELKLRQFVRTILNRLIGGDRLNWEMRLLVREMIEPTSALKRLVEDFIRPQHEILLGILRELAEEDVARHRLEQMAFSVIGQCLHYRLGGEFVALLIPEEERALHFEVETLTEHITSFSVAAIQAYASSSLRESDGGTVKAGG